MDKLLCNICGNMFSYIETLNRHLGSLQNNIFNCPNCKYTSPRKYVLKRHAKKHTRTECRLLTANNYHQTQTKGSKSRTETKAYQADPDNVNSYIYQQSLPKNKEIIPWILHELDTQPRNSRPHYILEPIIIPQETNETLPDPREWNQPIKSACISSEIDHILNQQYEISTSLSEFDMMLRQLRVRRCTTTKY